MFSFINKIVCPLILYNYTNYPSGLFKTRNKVWCEDITDCLTVYFYDLKNWNKKNCWKLKQCWLWNKMFSHTLHWGEITVCGGEMLLKLTIKIEWKICTKLETKHTQNSCNLLKQNISPASDTGRVRAQIDVYNSQ